MIDKAKISHVSLVSSGAKFSQFRSMDNHFRRSGYLETTALNDIKITLHTIRSKVPSYTNMCTVCVYSMYTVCVADASYSRSFVCFTISPIVFELLATLNQLYRMTLT